MEAESASNREAVSGEERKSSSTGKAIAIDFSWSLEEPEEEQREEDSQENQEGEGKEGQEEPPSPSKSSEIHLLLQSLLSNASLSRSKVAADSVRKIVYGITQAHADPSVLLKALLPSFCEDELEESDRVAVLKCVNEAVTASKEDQVDLPSSDVDGAARQLYQNPSGDTSASEDDVLKKKPERSRSRRPLSATNSASSLTALILSRTYLSQLVQSMQNPSSPVEIVEGVFVSGWQVVEWLMSEQAAGYTLEQAISVGQQLMDTKLLVPLDVVQKEFSPERNLWFTFESFEPEQNVHAKRKELLAILKKPIEFLAFNIFLEQTKRGHLLEFWNAVEGLKSNIFPGRQEERIEATISKYLNSSGQNRIIFTTAPVLDLLGEIDLKGKDGAQSNTIKFLFLAQTEVFNMLNDTSLIRFLKSSIYHYFAGKEKLSELLVEYLANRMKHPLSSLPKRDITVHSTIHSQAFTGRQVVDWMLVNICLTSREQGLQLLHEMMQIQEGALIRVEPDLRIIDGDIHYILRDQKKTKHRSSRSKSRRKERKERKHHNTVPEIKEDKDLAKKGSMTMRRPKLKSHSSKRTIIENWKEYSDSPLELQMDNLTLGATVRLNKKTRKVLGDSVEYHSAPATPHHATPEKVESVESIQEKTIEAEEKPKTEKSNAKEKLKRIATVFNESPKKAIECLITEGAIQSGSATDLAHYLHKNKFLNKANVGELLGNEDQFSVSVMHAFIEQLDFTDLDFDIALRHLLNCFRIPGESQKIDRILEKFAVEYYKQNPGDVFANSDAAWALAFATIMLNTDAHNPQVKKKMTKQQFVHNCRGINDGEDFPADYMEDLYVRIVLDEIRLLEDGALYPDAVKKGWASLKVSGGRRTERRWKRRWFVLLPKQLLLFKKPGDAAPHSTLDLSQCTLSDASDDGKRKFCLRLECKQATTAPILSRTWSLMSSVLIFDLALPSERELQSWNKVLQRSIDHACHPTSSEKRLRSSSF